MQIQTTNYSPNFSGIYQVGKASEAASVTMEAIANKLSKNESASFIKTLEDCGVQLGLMPNKNNSKIKLTLYGGNEIDGFFPLKSGQKGFSTQIGFNSKSLYNKFLSFIVRAADDISNNKVATNLTSTPKSTVQFYNILA